MLKLSKKLGILLKKCSPAHGMEASHFYKTLKPVP